MNHEHNRITTDAAPWHPTLVFVQDRETRDTLAVDVATGSIVGSHRGDYRRALSVELIDTALQVSAGVADRSRRAA